MLEQLTARSKIDFHFAKVVNKLTFAEIPSNPGKCTKTKKLLFCMFDYIPSEIIDDVPEKKIFFFD
jgi:hypothetical protein